MKDKPAVSRRLPEAVWRRLPPELRRAILRVDAEIVRRKRKILTLQTERATIEQVIATIAKEKHTTEHTTAGDTTGGTTSDAASDTTGPPLQG